MASVSFAFFFFFFFFAAIGLILRADLDLSTRSSDPTDPTPPDRPDPDPTARPARMTPGVDQIPPDDRPDPTERPTRGRRRPPIPPIQPGRRQTPTGELGKRKGGRGELGSVPPPAPLLPPHSRNLFSPVIARHRSGRRQPDRWARDPP